MAVPIVLNAISSSSPKPYDVTFSLEGNAMRVSCTCKAGAHGLCCKHRIAFLSGDAGMLADPAQSAQLQQVLAWSTQIGYLSMVKTILETEKEAERLKKKLTSLKRHLEESMSLGLKP